MNPAPSLIFGLFPPRLLALLTLLLASLLALSPPAHAVDGFDQPGNDYANFDAASASVCRHSCGGDANCRAWTWVKPGVQGPSGRCWLKNRQPALVRNNCCNSGSRENIGVADMKAEGHTDRPGADYRNFTTNAWETCEATCGREGRCAAWSHVQPGVQGPEGRCWLKTAVPRPIDNPRVASGVKFRPVAGSFDGGTNQVPANE